MYFFSNSAISGSFNDRPMSRFNDPTVFLKLEVSAVLADSPMYRCRGVNETKELTISSVFCRLMVTYGVARLETSLTIMSIPPRLATPILEDKFPKSIPTTLWHEFYSSSGLGTHSHDACFLVLRKGGKVSGCKGSKNKATRICVMPAEFLARR